MAPHINKVAVIGLGTMGAGIVEVFAKAGHEVYAVDGTLELAERGKGFVTKSLDRGGSKGKLAEADRHAIMDPATGLATGETSFMDWREQSYPRWMQPSDIARSAAVGTNAVHYATYRILADMAAGNYAVTTTSGQFMTKTGNAAVVAGSTLPLSLTMALIETP